MRDAAVVPDTYNFRWINPYQVPWKVWIVILQNEGSRYIMNWALQANIQLSFGTQNYSTLLKSKNSVFLTLQTLLLFFRGDINSL